MESGLLWEGVRPPIQEWKCTNLGLSAIGPNPLHSTYQFLNLVFVPPVRGLWWSGSGGISGCDVMKRRDSRSFAATNEQQPGDLRKKILARESVFIGSLIATFPSTAEDLTLWQCAVAASHM